MRVRHLVLVMSTFMVGACGNVGGDCQQEVTKQLTITTPADAPLQLRVDQCQVDVDACPALCTLAAQRANLTQSPQSCDVKFGATQVELDIKYQDFTGGIGCPGPEPQPGSGVPVGFGSGK